MINDILSPQPPHPWLRIREATCADLYKEIQQMVLPDPLQDKLILFLSDCKKLSLTTSSMVTYIDRRLMKLLNDGDISLTSELGNLHFYFQALYDSIREQELQREPDDHTHTAVLYASPDTPGFVTIPPAPPEKRKRLPDPEFDSILAMFWDREGRSPQQQIGLDQKPYPQNKMQLTDDPHTLYHTEKETTQHE